MSANAVRTNGKSTSRSRPPGAEPIEEIIEPMTVVLYGRSGTGKTTLAGSFPKPMLYLDVKDRGTASIKNIKDIDVQRITSMDELEDTHDWLLDRKHRGSYKTVVIDTVSQLQEVAIRERSDRSNRRGTRDKQPGDWGTLSQRDWGAIGSAVKNQIEKFRDLTDLGYYVVFIAQDRAFNINDEDIAVDDQLAPEIGPALSPGTAKVLNAGASMIGYTYIRERNIKKEVNGKTKTTSKTEYCLRLGPHSVLTSKVRKPKNVEIPSVIVDPTFDDLMEILKGEE